MHQLWLFYFHICHLSGSWSCFSLYLGSSHSLLSNLLTPIPESSKSVSSLLEFYYVLSHYTEPFASIPFLPTQFHSCFSASTVSFSQIFKNPFLMWPNSSFSQFYSSSPDFYSSCTFAFHYMLFLLSVSQPQSLQLVLVFSKPCIPFCHHLCSQYTFHFTSIPSCYPAL